MKVFFNNAFSLTSFCSNYVFATFSGPGECFIHYSVRVMHVVLVICGTIIVVSLISPARLFIDEGRARLELFVFNPVVSCSICSQTLCKVSHTTK